MNSYSVAASVTVYAESEDDALEAAATFGREVSRALSISGEQIGGLSINEDEATLLDELIDDL